jgi:hypothetical protein
MSRKTRLRRGPLVLHPPRRKDPPPGPLAGVSGPERVRLPAKQLPARPFSALAPLRWQMWRRDTGSGEQPPTPEEWK